MVAERIGAGAVARNLGGALPVLEPPAFERSPHEVLAFERVLNRKPDLMLRAIGQTYSVTPSGHLPRIGVMPSSPWDEYAKKICEDLQRNLGANLLSVAMRGSTVRATAVIGVSDLDLVVVTRNPVMDVAVPHIIAAPDLEVETALATEKQLLRDPGFAWLRHNLAFCGHTIWGRDYVSAFPDPKLDQTAMAHVKSVSRWLVQWEEMFAQAPDDKERKAICVWLMKRILRSLFESVMLQERAYTRDIYPCADVAARYYPDLRSAIFTAAELVIDPVTDAAKIKDALVPLRPALLVAQDEYRNQFQVAIEQV